MQNEMKAAAARVRASREKETALDEQITMETARLRQLIDQGSRVGLAFVSQDEVRTLSSLHDQTVIALRAPSGTTLEVPGEACHPPSCPAPSRRSRASR